MLTWRTLKSRFSSFASTQGSALSRVYGLYCWPRTGSALIRPIRGRSVLATRAIALTRSYSSSVSRGASPCTSMG